MFTKVDRGLEHTSLFPELFSACPYFCSNFFANYINSVVHVLNIKLSPFESFSSHQSRSELFPQLKRLMPFCRKFVLVPFQDRLRNALIKGLINFFDCEQ